MSLIKSSGGQCLYKPNLEKHLNPMLEKLALSVSGESVFQEREDQEQRGEDDKLSGMFQKWQGS